MGATQSIRIKPETSIQKIQELIKYDACLVPDFVDQINATCWFYAVLNALLHGTASRAFVVCKLNDWKRNPEKTMNKKQTYFYNKLIEILSHVYKPEGHKLIQSTKMSSRPLIILDGWIASKAFKSIASTLDMCTEHVCYKQFLSDLPQPKYSAPFLAIHPNTSLSFSLDENLPKAFSSNGKTYILDHGVLYIKFGMKNRHYVSAYISCYGIPIVIDSLTKSLSNTYDWTVPQQISKLIFTNGKVWEPEFIRIGYLVYVNRDCICTDDEKTRKALYYFQNYMIQNAGSKKTSGGIACRKKRLLKTSILIKKTGKTYVVRTDATHKKYICTGIDKTRIFLDDIRGKYIIKST